MGLAWLAWNACVGVGPAVRQPLPSSEPTTAPEPSVPSTSEPAGTLRIPDHVALPFATAGDPVGSAPLTVTGAEDPVQAVVTSGDFAIDDALIVRYTGPVDEPVLAAGAARVTVGDVVQDVALAAVLGDPDLPFPAWATDGWGTRSTAPYPSAPFPDGSAAWDDASVLVFVPAQLTDQGDLGVVTHLHGFGSELAVTIPYERLVEQHAMSGRDAIFVAPQGPENASSGDFGKLDDPGGHERLIRDVVAVLYRDGLVERPVLGAQVLTSHSGGYSASSALLQHGGLPFSAMFLYDSLYGYVSTFEDFARDGGVLFSDYSAYGGTDGNNVAMRSTLEGEGLEVSHDFRPDHLRADPVAIGFTASEHVDVMVDGLTHARWLAASPLRRSPLAAPELLSVVGDGATADVRWREDRVPAGLVTVVEGSDDGVDWVELGRSTVDRATVPARARIRLVGEDPRFGQGPPGDTYAGGGDWLVVDGFDRVFGGSWSAPTHDFAGRVGQALGGASTAEDDAVSEGLVDLREWDHVLWLLGDESTADVTFDDDAQAAITAYLDGGGHLLISGSELGYATDSAFLAELGVSYVADSAGTTVADGRTFGVVYPEDYPDVLASEETVWTYATGGGAAVGHDHRVLAVGFAIETLSDADLGPALAELADWL